MASRSSTPQRATRASSQRTRRSSLPSSSSSEASNSCEPASFQRQRLRSDDTQGTSIRVVARVRPKLARESRAACAVEVDVGGNALTLATSKTNGKKFYVDHVFDSSQQQGSQENVFSNFAMDFVHHSLNGYNVCMFAYGHTGSGKTYTMMGDENFDGNGRQAGILPRFLHELFSAHGRDAEQQMGRQYSCEFYEVYNEQIKDLLVPAKSGERTRKVHVHPKHGVRVENLTMSVVSSAEDALRLVDFGNKMRAVASTTMNARSSRSHAIFTFKYEQETCDARSCRSMVTFVDLAGREDLNATQNRATQFREMCCINTSLFHLASVITKLSQGSLDGRSLADFRNSKLTLLLSPALIGNSKTALIATVAPLQSFADDSLCTMNFAASVKKIRTRPVINNKNPNMVVSELEAEVRELQAELAICKTGEAEKERKLLSAQALIVNYRTSWEEALQKSTLSEMNRKKSLKNLGLSAQANSATGELEGELVPFFTKLSDDAALQGRCNYFLRGDIFRLGSNEKDCAIVLQGLGILPYMCEICMASDGSFLIKLLSNHEGAVPRVLVDGHPVSSSGGTMAIRHGTCLVLGYSQAFRFVVPTPNMAVAIGSTDPCVLARSTLPKLDVKSAVSEIVDEDGEQFKGILPYISHLSTRVADNAVQSFLAALHRICPLIDEANLITKEVFADEALRFELHALTNVFNFAQDVPELVVCLSQTRCTSGRSCTTDIHATAQTINPLVHAMGLGDHMRIGGNTALLYVWSLEKFLVRSNTIRDVYQEGSDAKDAFASTRRHLEANPDQNPWREAASADGGLLKDRCADTKYTIPAVATSAESRKDFSPPAESASCRSPTSSDSLRTNISSSSSRPESSHQTSWFTSLSPVDRLDSEASNVDEVSANLELQQSPDATANRSEDITRWLGQVMNLRSSVEPHFSNQSKENGRSQVPLRPSAISTDEAPQHAQRSITADAVTALKEELKCRLQRLELEHDGSNASSTGCSSELCSRSITPSDCTAFRDMTPDSLKSSPSLSCPSSGVHASPESLSSNSSPIASEESQEFQRLRADVLKMVQEEMSHQLRDLKLRRVSNSGSTTCSSGGRSGRMTPMDLEDCGDPDSPTVYRPKPQALESQLSLAPAADASLEDEGPLSPLQRIVRGYIGQRSDFSMSSDLPASSNKSLYPPSRSSTPGTDSRRGATPPVVSASCGLAGPPRSAVPNPAQRRHSIGPPMGSIRTPSPAPSRATLHPALMRRSFDGVPPALSSCRGSSCTKDSSTRPCIPSRSSHSPARRLVGPYPKVTWAYYEVPDTV